VAAVLVTDGEPTGCGSSVAEVSTVAKEYAATMPTYVVGVGTSLGNLNAIAEAGGTKKAFIVTDNGVETAKALGQALEEIRGAQISCDYKFPKQEGEKKFDVDKVNVVFSSGGANSTTFPYSKDCSVKGWRYDNVSAPTKIELCPETCAAVKSDTAAQVDVQFGCETLGGVPR
jgi:hypothetical protein